MAAILGDPQIDPHGHLIPHKYAEGSFPDEAPLLAWSLGAPARISSVNDKDPAALRDLERLGLRPGVALVVEKNQPGAAVFVRVAGEKRALRLSHDLAKCLAVSPPAAV